ncbi:hypothetical protein, partial [Deinococcus pimensis]|uniref:hypothetical protein n=1 Tax=Deinococcus pimensis TaxID=309888 RepID=UPI001B7FBEF5
HGVEGTGLVRVPGRRTLLKQRVCSSSQILLRLDSGSTEDLDTPAENELLLRLSDAWATCDAVIVSDYGYGILTHRVVSMIELLQARDPRVLVVDAKDPTRYRGARPTAVKPNYAEVTRLLGVNAVTGEARVEQVMGREQDVLDLTGARVAAVTLDVDGGVVLERGRPAYRTFTRP